MLRIFTFVSFILFGASATMCVRSFWLGDFLGHQRVERTGSTLLRDERILVSGRGGLCLGMSHTVWTLPHRDMSDEQIAGLRSGWQHERLCGAGYGGDYFKATKQPMKFGFGRAKVEITLDGVTEKGRLIVFPWGAALLAFGFFPLIGTIRFIKARRRLRRLAALNFNGMQTRRAA